MFLNTRPGPFFHHNNMKPFFSRNICLKNYPLVNFAFRYYNTLFFVSKQFVSNLNVICATDRCMFCKR